MQEVSFCVATVPHTGSHSVVDRFGLKFVPPGERPRKFPCWTHTDNMEWLRTTPAALFTTWRDPLLCAISFKARGTWSEFGPLDPKVHSAKRFRALWTNWLELRHLKHVAVLDIKFNPVIRKNSSRGLDLYKAYEQKDLKHLLKQMPEFIKAVREIPWGDEPLQGWYR